VQPLAALIGFVMGSSVALLAGLIMTLLVFLLLPDLHDRLSVEFRPLLVAIAWAVLLSATSVAAFLGQIRKLPWRTGAALATAAAVLVVGWYYWPD
jgi:hypothetical protein